MPFPVDVVKNTVLTAILFRNCKSKGLNGKISRFSGVDKSALVVYWGIKMLSENRHWGRFVGIFRENFKFVFM